MSITKTTPATTTQAEAKVAGIKAAGQVFAQERSAKYGGGFTGNVGIVLAELSPKGKLQAEMTCLKCDATHTRESSDWHQSLFCRTCKPTAAERKAAAPTPGAGNGGVGGRKVVITLDGKEEILREMTINPSDDEEMKTLKQENNELFAALWAEQEAEKAKEKAAKTAEAEKVKLQAQATKMEALKKERLARLDRVKAYAQEHNLAVSPKTAQEALDAEIAAQ